LEHNLGNSRKVEWQHWARYGAVQCGAVKTNGESCEWNERTHTPRPAI